MRIDGQAGQIVLALQRAVRSTRPGGHIGDQSAVRAAKAKLVPGAALHAEPAFVEETMMMRAQLDQILQSRRASARPVMDVVGVQELAMSASGEAAATVTTAQRTA